MGKLELINIILMSKNLTREVRLDVLKLYRNILKLHVQKLPEDARLFGDFFVKSEFTMNYTKADSQQIRVFLKEYFIL
jgi:hypothetical protein